MVDWFRRVGTSMVWDLEILNPIEGIKMSVRTLRSFAGRTPRLIPRLRCLYSVPINTDVQLSLWCVG